jgi:hypothetical protein
VIPPSALGNRLYLFLWIVVLLLPVAGWLVAALVTAAFGRRGTGNPLWRAAVHAGEMAALALAIPFLVRILLWGVLAVRGGPIDWAAWLLAPHPVVLADFLLIYAAIPLGLAALFGTPVLALVGALLREKPPLRVPLGGPLAAALITSALVVPFVARFALSDPDADVALADLFAALPVSAVGLAIWTASLRRAPPAKPEPVRPATPAGPPAIDIPGLWRAMGAIDAEQQPLVHPGVDRTGGSPFATSAWRDAGGAGAPPEALDHLLTAVEKPGGSYLIGDLDDDTERALLVALLVSALRDKSLTTVVVTEDPGPFRDAVAHALSRGGWWECGPLVAGAEELRGALAGARLPAVAFLDVAGLSGSAIRALGADEAGVEWARRVGLVVVSRIDRGSPLDLTHRVLTLRRLGLAFQAAATRSARVVTGLGGDGSRGLVEQAFPGTGASEIPFGPRASAPVTAWFASRSFVREASDRAWVRRALQPVLDTGRGGSVSDPDGHFDRADVAVWGRDLVLGRAPMLHGSASAGTLPVSWLVAGYRSMPHRSGPIDGERHHALWDVAASPVARFLTGPSQLENLARAGRLPPPRPLVGAGNPLVARAHLQAALREGRPSKEALVALFGRSLVDPIVGDDVVGYATREVGGAVRRVGLVATPPDPMVDPLRSTVTGQVVRVVDRHGGAVLAEVDKAVAATRYYPKRVFAVGDRRYEVELHRYDEKSQSILVDPVAADATPTRPRLSVQVVDARPIEARHRVKAEGLTFELEAYELTAVERITGALAASGRSVTYDPVEVRFRTRGRLVALPPMSDAARRHLAASLSDVLCAHLLADADDFAVTTHHELGPGALVVVDRHVQGMGVVEALDDLSVARALSWVRALLASCSCATGCPKCTPDDVIAQADKIGVLGALGG